jgi:hypothetical protein
LDKTGRTFKDNIAMACCLIWPFVFLFPYVMPWHAHYATVGNDFKPLYYNYKFYWIAAMSNGFFPHWSPSEACGFPFFSNPFAAALYPLNYLLLPLYSLLHGYSMLDHQRFAVLGISIFTTGLYAWLRFALGFDRRSCLVSALIIGISSRMTELLRFPNAIHSAAWYPWILLCLHKIFVSKTKREALFSAIGLAIALMCLITAGYPYMAFYLLFLAIPYALMLAIPVARQKMFTINTPISPYRIMFAIGSVCVTLCSTLFYLRPMKMLLNQTTDRSGGSWSYSTFHIFSMRDSVGSFVYPLAANFEGIFYFSAVALLLIFCSLLKKRPKGGRWPLLILGLWIASISSITHGASSPLFYFLWHTMPGFDSLRVWGRASILLLPLFAWLIARAYSEWETTFLDPAEIVGRSDYRRNLLIGLCGIVGIQLYFFFSHTMDLYWKIYFFEKFSKYVWKTAEPNVILGYQYFYLAMPWIAGVVLMSPVGITRLRVLPKMPRLQHLFLILILATASLDLWATGPWLWYGGPHPTGDRRILDYGSMLEKSFSYPRIAGFAGLPLSPKYSVGLMSNWYFQRYRDFLEFANKEPVAERSLLGIDAKGRRIFMTDSLQYKTVTAFIKAADPFPWNARLLRYTGDELVLTVTCQRAGFLSFIDNWDPHWRASIDDRPIAIDLLFGTFKAIAIPAGDHEVRFYYAS